MRLPAEIEKLLASDVVTLAAHAFVATFTGVKLGRQAASGKVLKSLKAQFGNPRWTDANYQIFEAVSVEIQLVFERTRVTARTPSGPLLLPRGVRLLEAPDPVAALRELLSTSW
jgi:hypothetical protein